MTDFIQRSGETPTKHKPNYQIWFNNIQNALTFTVLMNHFLLGFLLFSIYLGAQEPLCFPQMSDVSRALTVICPRCLHSPSLLIYSIPLLFLASIFLAATYYLQISLFLISFYSISVCDNFSYSFINLCLCVSFVFYSLLLQRLLFSSISQCLQSLFVSNVFLRYYQPHFSFSLSFCHVPHNLCFCHCQASCWSLLLFPPFHFHFLPFPTANQVVNHCGQPSLCLCLWRKWKMGPHWYQADFCFLSRPALHTGSTLYQRYICQRLKQLSHELHKKTA